MKAAKGPRAEPPAARAEAVLLLPAGFFLLEISFCKRCREKKPRSAAGWQRPGGTRWAGGWQGFGEPRGDQAGRYGDVWGGWLGTRVCGGELRVGRGKGDEHGVTKAVRGWVRAQEQILLGYAGRELTPPTNFCFLEARLSFISHSVGAEAVQVLSAWPFLKACCRGWAVGIDSP